MRIRPSYCLLLAAVTLSACSVRGPLTKAYLEAVEKRQAELRSALDRLPRLAAPQPPGEPPRGSPKSDLVAFHRQLGEFKQEEIGYLSAMMKRSEDLDRLYGDFEERLGSISTSDVDPSAVALIRRRIALIGERRRMILSIGALAGAEKEKASKYPNAALGQMVSGAIVGFLLDPLTPEGAIVGAAKGLGHGIRAEQAQDQDIATRVSTVQSTFETFKIDLADYQTAKADLVAKVQEDYPKEDWRFLTGELPNSR